MSTRSSIPMPFLPSQTSLYRSNPAPNSEPQFTGPNDKKVRRVPKKPNESGSAQEKNSPSHAQDTSSTQGIPLEGISLSETSDLFNRSEKNTLQDGTPIFFRTPTTTYEALPLTTRTPSQSNLLEEDFEEIKGAEVKEKLDNEISATAVEVSKTLSPEDQIKFREAQDEERKRELIAIGKATGPVGGAYMKVLKGAKNAERKFLAAVKKTAENTATKAANTLKKAAKTIESYFDI